MLHVDNRRLLDQNPHHTRNCDGSQAHQKTGPNLAHQKTGQSQAHQKTGQGHHRGGQIPRDMVQYLVRDIRECHHVNDLHDEDHVLVEGELIY